MDGMIILEQIYIMKTNYFSYIFLFIILAGCSNDKITPELPPKYKRYV